MIVYRNTIYYEQFIRPFFQRLSSVEHLTLILAIGARGVGLNHFIDGFDLQRDIVSYMSHLRQFNFHIRSVLGGTSHIDIDTIRQSFIQQKQPVDFALDYFNNNYSQCQIYSLPFIGNRLDFISNRFPLFDVNNTFSNVTKLLLFDDIKPFENAFFERLARALPHLKILDVFNQLEQEEKTKITADLIEFPQLAALILHYIHADYAEQLLCRSRLPCLIELIIRRDPLLVIIADNNKQARDNCSNVQSLRIVEPRIELTSDHLNFFPLISIL
jgi:hypothetical protein